MFPQSWPHGPTKNNGAIILWWDESEEDSSGDNADDFNHTIGEIVISPLAQPNVGGLPFASSVSLSHSSDLRTMQEIVLRGQNLANKELRTTLCAICAPSRPRP